MVGIAKEKGRRGGGNGEVEDEGRNDIGNIEGIGQRERGSCLPRMTGWIHVGPCIYQVQILHTRGRMAYDVQLEDWRLPLVLFIIYIFMLWFVYGRPME